VYENYKRTFRLVLKPALGDVELAALTPEHMDALVTKLRKEAKADNTIRNQMIPIRSMLNHALKRKRISANPALALEISGGKRRKIVPPTREQIAKLTEHVRTEARDALIVATVTGLRRGELFAMRWADVDFSARTIRVHATNHAGHVTETTKTEAGERFVPLFESARKVLAARKLQMRYSRPEDFVFGTTVGTPMEPGNFVRREFKPAIDRAGLPMFRFHDLRHFAVSALIAEGADIKLLQAIAGHASATVTLDTYGHLMTDRISEAARRYDPLPPKVRPKGRRQVDARPQGDRRSNGNASIQARRGVAQPG
jgi:integrase